MPRYNNAPGTLGQSLGVGVFPTCLFQRKKNSINSGMGLLTVDKVSLIIFILLFLQLPHLLWQFTLNIVFNTVKHQILASQDYSAIITKTTAALDVKFDSPFDDFHSSPLPHFNDWSSAPSSESGESDNTDDDDDDDDQQTASSSPQNYYYETTAEKLTGFAVNHMLQQSSERRRRRRRRSISLVRTISPFLCLSDTNGRPAINQTFLAGLQALQTAPDAEWWLLTLDGLAGGKISNSDKSDSIENEWIGLKMFQRLTTFVGNAISVAYDHLKSTQLQILTPVTISTIESTVAEWLELIPLQFKQTISYIADIYKAGSRRQFGVDQQQQSTQCSRRLTDLLESGQGRFRVVELSESDEPIVPFTNIRTLFMRIRLDDTADDDRNHHAAIIQTASE